MTTSAPVRKVHDIPIYTPKPIPLLPEPKGVPMEPFVVPKRVPVAVPREKKYA